MEIVIAFVVGAAVGFFAGYRKSRNPSGSGGVQDNSGRDVQK